MTSHSAPDTVRQWRRIPPINAAANDYTNKNGVRISLPVYIDITTNQRKELLNGVREAMTASPTLSAPTSMSGIRVETVNGTQPDIESYLGMTVDILRNVLFQRGGIEAGLLLRLQEVSGVTFVTDKDFQQAFKQRQEFVKGYTAEYPYQSNVETET